MSRRKVSSIVARFMTAVVALTLVAHGPVRAQDPGTPGTPEALPPEMVKLVEEHNREREKAKLGPLVANQLLTAAARQHAADMAEHDMMSHEGSDGSKFNERIERQGYHGRRMAENVARAQRSVDAVMRAWMNSPHHRENILGPYDEIGVAVARSEDGVPFWCTTFGLSRPKLDRDESTASLVEALNGARKEADKPPLKVSRRLNEAAQEVAQELAARGDLGEGKGGTPPDERVRRTGYRFRSLGEAAALGQLSGDEVVKTWLKSDSHRENFLGQFSEIGVGLATSDKGIPFWSVFLAQPAR